MLSAMPVRTIAPIVILFVPLLPQGIAAETAATTAPATTADPAATTTAAASAAAPAVDALQTAVALNYCRASFHRIRKYPTRDVLAEEQEKILNNINLDGIADREVIQLYTAVLDEINQIIVADYERRLAQQYHNTVMQRKFVWDALAIGADVASGEYGDAVRHGVNSWWDFRIMDYQKDSELLKIDKLRLVNVVQKSSLFLDTFWQMTQKKHIPDRWLVRADDLDALEQAMREPDPEVRLRVLKRMETFMEAYPPYWYYVARTQQQLGQLFAALNTYAKVVELGGGHFRKDDMLATALSNQAAIQDYLAQPSAGETARQALVHSTDVWEANLICARVLQRQGDYAAAEDAILRNLDVGLETEQSRVFLVVLYESGNQRDKLLRQLNDPQLVARLPAPVLLRCAARLGQDSTPPDVLRTVVDSLEGQPRVQFGPDDFVLQASSAWLLNLASLRVYYQGEELSNPEVTAGNGRYTVRYASRFDWGNPLGPAPVSPEFEVRLTYPDHTEVRLVLGVSDPAASTPAARIVTSRVTGSTLRIAQIEVGDERTTTTNELETSPMPLETSVPESATPDLTPSVEIPLPPRTEPAASY
jgi:hypothetical protein